MRNPRGTKNRTRNGSHKVRKMIAVTRNAINKTRSLLHRNGSTAIQTRNSGIRVSNDGFQTKKAIQCETDCLKLVGMRTEHPPFSTLVIIRPFHFHIFDNGIPLPTYFDFAVLKKNVY